MSEFGADHAQISVEFLRRSREYLANGSLLQSSEKGWGAAAHAAKLFAGARDGLIYERHEHLDDVITEMGIETNIYRQIREWVNKANLLHQNFYKDDLDANTVAVYLDDVANFVNLTRQLTGLPPVEP